MMGMATGASISQDKLQKCFEPMNEASSPKHSEIVTQLLLEDGAIELLHSLMTQLEERLRPVLVERPTPNSSCEMTERGMLSPFGSAIEKHAESVNHAAHRVRTLLHCLSV